MAIGFLVITSPTGNCYVYPRLKKRVRCVIVFLITSVNVTPIIVMTVTLCN